MPSLLLLIILVVVVLVLNECFSDNGYFNRSAVCFFVFSLLLFLSKNALKPRGEGFGPRNDVKQYYEAKEMLWKYSKICNWAFVILGLLGLVWLVLGLFGI